MNISCLEELQMKLDLCISREERLQLLNAVGQKIEYDRLFVVTDDGQCHLFDRDGMLDDVSKITKICEQHVRKDIKRIYIPDSVTSIGGFAFANCRSLTSVAIPDSVTHIEDWVFAYCTSLKNMTMPDSVTSIGYHAFSNCSGLTSVTIPDSVTSIGRGVFHNCTSLTSVTFKGKTLDQVKAMDNYPWEINDTHIIYVE